MDDRISLSSTLALQVTQPIWVFPGEAAELRQQRPAPLTPQLCFVQIPDLHEDGRWLCFMPLSLGGLLCSNR